MCTDVGSTVIRIKFTRYICKLCIDKSLVDHIKHNYLYKVKGLWFFLNVIIGSQNLKIAAFYN